MRARRRRAIAPVALRSLCARRRRRAPTSATTSASRSRRSASMIEGRETTDPALLAGRRDARRAAAVDGATCARASRTCSASAASRTCSVDASARGGGVALRYDLDPDSSGGADRVRRAASTRPGIDTGELRRAVVDRFGASPPLGRVADIDRASSTTQLRERGYLHAAVTPRAELEHAPERATLVFTDRARRRARAIGTVDVVGTPTCRAEALLGARPRAGRAVRSATR